jgi:ring-1,2-phenylacetyl-CoA epoxidase subunit PaaD
VTSAVVAATVAEEASSATTLELLRVAAGAVADPEIPVLTLSDLGILRDVQLSESTGASGIAVVVTLTPTYTGCTATAVIAADVTAALRAAGADHVETRTVLSPAWTTDWITSEGRRKLTEYGIAPPGQCVPAESRPRSVGLTLSARCPRCGSTKTREVSRFGSTPCKAHWTCRSCLEPFDSFKAI